MKVRPSTCFRVGRIRYHNTLPFYHGLTESMEGEGLELQWTIGSPAQLNLKMRDKAVDIAPVSSLEYLNQQDAYLLFPDLCIGSRDFSSSVLLLSKVPIEGLQGATVSLSEESLSSAALLKILLKFKFRFENSFLIEPSNPVEMLAHTPACLVIGDEGLFFRPKEFVYKIDLSEVWWDWTGLPFCFSLWAVRRDYYRRHADEVRTFYRKLKSNLERNLLDLERLLREGLGLNFSDGRFPVVFGYLFNLSYGLDGSMKEGLLRFFDYAHQLGISPSPKRLKFIEV